MTSYILNDAVELVIGDKTLERLKQENFIIFLGNLKMSLLA